MPRLYKYIYIPYQVYMIIGMGPRRFMDKIQLLRRWDARYAIATLQKVDD